MSTTKRNGLVAVAALGLVMAAAAGAGERAGASRGRRAPLSHADAGWRQDALWDDGLAEYAVYEVQWARYGRHYSGRAVLVAVKEPWAAAADVKADRAEDAAFDVLKLNHIRDVPTGIYAYHQMASVFMRRDDGTVRKIAAASMESCGLSSARMVKGRLATHSYFEGDGDQEVQWPAGALPEDGLPLLLRDHVRGDVPESLLVFPTLMDSRHPKLEPARFAVARQPRAVEVPAGRFEGVELALTAGSRVHRFTFGAESPHVLLAYEGDDGTTYRLAKVERIAYWERNEPEGAAWLPAGPR